MLLLVTPNTYMKILGYGSDAASLSSLMSFAGKQFVCMLPAQSLRNSQSCTKIFEYKLKLFLICYSSGKNIDHSVHL